MTREEMKAIAGLLFAAATFGPRAVRYERLRRRTMCVTERQGEAA